MKKRNPVWFVTAALGGFLLAFNACTLSMLLALCEGAGMTGVELLGLILMIGGTVVGSILAGWSADLLGRRTALIVGGFLYAFAPLGWLFCSRFSFSSVFMSCLILSFVGGLSLGFSAVAGLLYIGELAPAPDRGRMSGMFQFSILLGACIAFFFGELLTFVAPILSIIYAGMCFRLPESPRWLIDRRRNRTRALQALQRIEPDLPPEKLEAQVNEITGAAAQEDALSGWLWPWRWRISILLVVAFLNQLLFINTTYFVYPFVFRPGAYLGSPPFPHSLSVNINTAAHVLSIDSVFSLAPLVFQPHDLPGNSSFLGFLSVVITALIFTFTGAHLSDRVGRRYLLYLGISGGILSQGLAAWAFFTNHQVLIPGCTFLSIASYFIGQGTVMGALLVAVFPTRYRGRGLALGCMAYWVLIGLLFRFCPSLLSISLPGDLYLLSFGLMVAQLVWVKFMAPETKGLSLEEINSTRLPKATRIPHWIGR